MDGFDFNDPASGVVFNLEQRNHLAEERIAQAMVASGASNLLLGLVAFIPFPGAATASVIASIMAQAGVVIPAMTRDISRIYLATPEELGAVNAIVIDSAKSVSTIDIGSELTVDILEPIVTDLLLEVGFGAAATLIPVIGGVAAIGIDLVVMPMMTARVGRMTSIYYQNQARWKNDSKQETYDAAKNMGDDLNGVRRSMVEVRTTLLKNVKSLIGMMIPDLSKERIRQLLKERKIPDDLIDEALAEF